jgi:subtilisin family serine protease
MTFMLTAAWRRIAAPLLLAALAGLAACTTAPTLPPARGNAGDAQLLIVAIADTPEPLPGAGSVPRADYRRASGYAGGTRAQAVADDIAADHMLAQQAVWTITSLQLRCMLYRVPADVDRSAVLARLQTDPRIALAQPLNRFDTYATPTAYNDPLIGLQRGFAVLDAAGAQQWASGEGVRVAVIDSGVDSAHPDLQGRIAGQRDFAVAMPAARDGDVHGTQVAGLIAAGANNGVGIVGIAPRARLLTYRACWAAGGAAGGSPGASRCDSFSLAQALGAAIADGADIINLSLGGPADPLLARLATRAIERGSIVVGAMPPSGLRDGFPAGVPGVVMVASSDDGMPAPGVLAAPGRAILTLAPGGHYDYASGSSLAAAQVSGALALLRSLQPGLRGDAALAGLAGPGVAMPAGVPLAASATGTASINLCAAVQRLRAAAECAPAAR